MLPWEHLAIGYILYSLGARVLGREPPSDCDIVAIVLATQLPDLIDKPLSWGFGWFPSGYAVGHSVFFGVGLSIVVVALARRVRRSHCAVAFLVAYWSHLFGDVLGPLRSGGAPLVTRILWPIPAVDPYETDHGLGRGVLYLDRFVSELAAMDPRRALMLYGLVPFTMVLLWLLDGKPGTALLFRSARRLLRRS